jgi:hypothetical protein
VETCHQFHQRTPDYQLRQERDENEYHNGYEHRYKPAHNPDYIFVKHGPNNFLFVSSL